jgi:hypothetical protein
MPGVTGLVGPAGPQGDPRPVGPQGPAGAAAYSTLHVAGACGEVPMPANTPWTFLMAPQSLMVPPTGILMGTMSMSFALPNNAKGTLPLGICHSTAASGQALTNLTGALELAPYIDTEAGVHTISAAATGLTPGTTLWVGPCARTTPNRGTISAGACSGFVTY